jgi:ectoine hydroxylase-related dioxygenase (phytanoyl-CoA dioxygenase family)
VPATRLTPEKTTVHVSPAQFMEEGFLVVRGVVPADQLDSLRTSAEVLVERQKAIWARERRPGDPPGGVWDTSAQPRLFIDDTVDESTADTVEICLHENTLGVSQQLMPAPEVGLHAMFMMCSPQRDHGPITWHRDTAASADPPLQGLHIDMMANGPGYLQWNIPLYDDDVLWVIPGSHRRGNTQAEDRQLTEDPRVPLPGGVPVDLKAGDGVVYTNFMLHWGSNYSTRLRRTLNIGYQSFGGPIYRYFHSWWDLEFTKNLPPELRAPFRRWAGWIARDHDLVESIYRAMLARDADAFRARLASLHPGPQGRMVCAITLCKVAQRIHEIACASAETRAPARSRIQRLHDDLARRFTEAEMGALWSRFGVLDARLQSAEVQLVPGAQFSPAKYRAYEMPTSFDLEDFIASWVRTPA